MFREILAKWQVRRGKAVDIWSKGPYPADVLSNLCSNSFRFEGVVCGSMEGFLQALKQRDPVRQRQICSMKGRKARKMSVSGWQTDQIVWWKGRAIDRQGKAYHRLLRQAYEAMFRQNERFRTALMATRGLKLFHSRGERNPYKTILTEQELCGVLMAIRAQYDNGDRLAALPRRRVLVDLNGTIAGCTPTATMAALEALSALEAHVELYLLADVPAVDFQEWWRQMAPVAERLPESFRNRLVLTACRDVCVADYFVTANGGSSDAALWGEVVALGSAAFPDWAAVADYLRDEAGANVG